MKRRNFLQSIVLILWHPWPGETTPTQPSIYEYEDGGYLIEVGCLRCGMYADLSGSLLEFNVYVTDHPVPGTIRERRMVPSEILKKKLERVGFPTEFEGHPKYPSLVGRMSRFLSPNQVADKLQRVLAGCDFKLLYHNPGSRR